jgi:plasmid stability protein
VHEETRIVIRHARERVTIDLRGIGPKLHARAALHGKTPAAVVRAAVVAMLDAEGGPVEPGCIAEPTALRVVKVTMRLGALHAARLADRARSADVSQGTYVTGLLDGTPPSPRSVDHGAAVAALADSTQKVAAMSADIHGFIRLIRSVKSHEAEKYRASLMSLSKNMRLHLEVASRLMAGLTSRQRTNGSGVTARRGEGAPK